MGDCIDSVALYYFDISNNIKGGGLTFKDGRKLRTGKMYGGAGSEADSINIQENQCVFFRNDPFKYKVEKMNIILRENENDHQEIYKNKNGEKVFGTRKLLEFFILDSKSVKIFKSVKTSNELIVN